MRCTGPYQVINKLDDTYEIDILKYDKITTKTNPCFKYKTKPQKRLLKINNKIITLF